MIRDSGRSNLPSHIADWAMLISETAWNAKLPVMLSQVYKECSDTRVRLVFSLALANSQDARVILEKQPAAVGPLAHAAKPPHAAPGKAQTSATMTAAATVQAAIPAGTLQQSPAAARTGRPQRAAAAVAAAAIAAGAEGCSQNLEPVQSSGRNVDSSFELRPQSSEGSRPLQAAPGPPVHANITTIQRPAAEQQQQQLTEAGAMHQQGQAATARKGRRRFKLVARPVRPGLDVGPETPATAPPLASAAPTAADAGEPAAPPATTGCRPAERAATAGRLRPPSLVIRTTAAAAAKSSAPAIGSPTLAARATSANSPCRGANFSPRSSAFGPPRASAGRLNAGASVLAGEGRHDTAATASPVARSRAASQVDGWSSAWGPHKSGIGRPLSVCPTPQLQPGAAQSPRSINRKPAARHVLDRVLTASSQAPAVRDAVREAAAARVIKEAAAAKEAAAKEAAAREAAAREAAAREAAEAAARSQRLEAEARKGVQAPCMPPRLPSPAGAALHPGATLPPDSGGSRPAHRTPSSPTGAGRRDAASPTAQQAPLGTGSPRDGGHSLRRDHCLEAAAQPQSLQQHLSSEDHSSKRKRASEDAARDPHAGACSLQQQKRPSDVAAKQRPLEREPSACDRGLKRQRHSSECAAQQRPLGPKPHAGKDSLERQQRSSTDAAQQRIFKRQRAADKRRLERQQLPSHNSAQLRPVKQEPPAGDGRLMPQRSASEGVAQRRPVKREPSADGRSVGRQQLSSEGAVQQRPVKREPPGEERTPGRRRSADGDRRSHRHLPSPGRQQHRRQRPRQRPRSESQQPPWQEWEPPQQEWEPPRQEWQPPQVRPPA